MEVAPEIKPYFDFAMEQSLLNDSHEKAKAGFKISFIFIFVMGWLGISILEETNFYFTGISSQN